MSSSTATDSRSGWCSAARKNLLGVRSKLLMAILADTLFTCADSRASEASVVDRKPNEFGDTLELQKLGAGKNNAIALF